MLVFKQLGEPSVRRSGTIVGGRAVQGRRLALMAVLASVRGSPVTRDKVIGLLWPESPTHRARHQLSDTLYLIRSALGEDVIRSSGDDLILDAELVASDAADFERWVEDGQLERALAIYRGPLLDGFHLSDAAPFEHWLDGERSRLSQRYATALEDVARRTEDAGDFSAAVEWWRKLAAHDPYNGRIALGLMRCLDAAGDRAGALRHARVHAGLLNEEFEAEGDSEVAAFAEQLRRIPLARPTPRPDPPTPLPEPAPGEVIRTSPEDLRIGAGALAAADRLAVPPVDPPMRPPGTVTPVTSPAPAVVSRAGLSRFGGRVALVAAGAAVVLLAVWRSGKAPDDVATDPQVVAILPFRVAGADARLEYLREGMLDLLAAKLTGEGGPRAVDPRTLLAAWRRSGGGPERDLSGRDATTLASGLGAGHLLFGEVVGTPERLVINASLARSGDAKVLQRASVSGPADSVALLADRLAGTLLALAAGEQPERLDQLLTTSPEALRAYLDGTAAYRASDYLKATEAFRRALRLDSTFTLAGARLAMSGEWNASTVSDARLGRAVARAGSSRLSRADRLLVQLGGFGSDPDDPSAVEWLRMAQELVQLAPDAAESWFLLGDALIHAGSMVGLPDFRRRAAAALDRAIALDSSFAPPRFHRIELAAIERDTAALQRLHRLSGSLPHGPAWLLGVALGDSALVARAERALMNERVLPDLNYVATRAIYDDHGVGRLETFLPQRPRARTREGAIDTETVDAALGRGARSEDPRGALVWLLEAALGDSAGGGAVAVRLRDREAELCAPHAPPPETRPYDSQLCRAETDLALGLFAGRRGDGAAMARHAQRIRSQMSAQLPRRPAAALELAVRTLEAVQSGISSRPETSAVARLDSAASSAATDDHMVLIPANVALASLQARLGQVSAARRALRARYFYAALLTGPALREEGRLAAMAGDTAAAVRAYRHFLVLRGTAPGGRPQVDSVRAELAGLVAERSRKPTRP